MERRRTNQDEGKRRSLTRTKQGGLKSNVFLWTTVLVLSVSRQRFFWAVLCLYVRCATMFFTHRLTSDGSGSPRQHSRKKRPFHGRSTPRSHEMLSRHLELEDPVGEFVRGSCAHIQFLCYCTKPFAKEVSPQDFMFLSCPNVLVFTVRCPSCWLVRVLFACSLEPLTSLVLDQTIPSLAICLELNIAFQTVSVILVPFTSFCIGSDSSCKETEKNCCAFRHCFNQLLAGSTTNNQCSAVTSSLSSELGGNKFHLAHSAWSSRHSSSRHLFAGLFTDKNTVTTKLLFPGCQHTALGHRHFRAAHVRDYLANHGKPRMSRVAFDLTWSFVQRCDKFSFLRRITSLTELTRCLLRFIFRVRDSLRPSFGTRST